MAHSLLQFHEAVLEVRDSTFEGLLTHARRLLKRHSVYPETQAWLPDALATWFDYWYSMPPGRKRIRFDDVFSSHERVAAFCSLLAHLREVSAADSPHLDWLALIATRVHDWLAHVTTSPNDRNA